MYIPRPCATRSVNLTAMEYYYGQWADTYDIRIENQDKVLAMMNSEREFIFQNGSTTGDFVKFGTKNLTDNYTIYV
jgi:hypothetical protein